MELFNVFRPDLMIVILYLLICLTLISLIRYLWNKGSK